MPLTPTFLLFSANSSSSDQASQPITRKRGSRVAAAEPVDLLQARGRHRVGAQHGVGQVRGVLRQGAHGEIAEVMQRSEPACRGLLYRATAQLGVLLG